MTRVFRRFGVWLCLGFIAPALLCLAAVAQDKSDSPNKTPQPSRNEVASRVTIEVTGGSNDVPVENASVYVKYVEERTLRKDKKVELNVKTSRDGVAHVANAPMGRALVQVIAEGWKTYGRWYDINEPKQVIKIHLERPPKWY